MDQERASRVLTAEAVVGFTFAALLLLFPDRLLEVYGISTGSGPVVLARLIGAELLGLNVASVVGVRGDRRVLAPLVRGHLVNDRHALQTGPRTVEQVHDVSARNKKTVGIPKVTQPTNDLVRVLAWR